MFDGAEMANFGDILRPVFSSRRVQHVSDLHPKFAHTMCGSIVDFQSATAEIRRGKKKKIEETTRQNIMSAFAKQGGHNNN